MKSGGQGWVSRSGGQGLGKGQCLGVKVVVNVGGSRSGVKVVGSRSES